MGKKSPCISQGMKKHSLLIDFSKIMCHDGFLSMQIMHPEPNYAISHLRIIPEALNKVIWRVDTLLLFCFVAGGGGGGGGGKTASRKKNVTCKKAKFNTSYLITSWILRCNWIRCIKPTLLFCSIKHNVLNYVGHFCFHYYMYMYNNVIITAVISFIRWCQASLGEDSDGLD